MAGLFHHRERCDECNGLCQGTTFKCQECDHFILCVHCRRSGAHGHHIFCDSKHLDSENGSYRPHYQTSYSLPYGIVPQAAPMESPTNMPLMKSCWVETRPDFQRTLERERPESVHKAKHDPEKRRTLPTPLRADPVVPPVIPPRRNPYGEVKPAPDPFTAKWAPVEKGRPFRRELLSYTDPEYQSVIRAMRIDEGSDWVKKVTSIHRIENHTLYNSYKTRKNDLEEENGRSFQNQRILWHGTSADVLTAIYRDGFNRGYCGKNATKYGNGVYFSTSFAYSAEYYSPADNKGQKYIFQCLVLTGHFTKGKEGLKEPPMRHSEARYDSVVDDESSPLMFVVFKDWQVYPAYVITLKE